MYIKYHSVPGQGIFRAWRNGELWFEDTITRIQQELGIRDEAQTERMEVQVPFAHEAAQTSMLSEWLQLPKKNADQQGTSACGSR